MKKVKKDKELENEIEDKINEKEEIVDDNPFFKVINDPEKISWLDTGSVPQNLALSQKGIDGGIPRGRITNIVGDNSSGKTVQALEICARAFHNPKPSIHFPKTKKFDIVFNNNECTLDFCMEKMFNKYYEHDKNGNLIVRDDDFTKSVQWQFLPTIEKVAKDIANRAKKLPEDTGLIFIIDSYDALKSDKDLERFEKEIKEEKEGKKKKSSDDGDEKKSGSYMTDKASYASKVFFKNLPDIMNDRDITLVIVSQTRIKIGALHKEYYRTGEGSLNFYCHLVYWLSVAKKFEKTVEGQEFLRAINTRTRVKKSKVSKPFRESESLIVMDYGIDNIGSCLNYLVGYSESYPVQKIIDVIGIDKNLLSEVTVTRIRLTDIIEKNNLETMLSKKVESVWLAREAKVEEPRKRKF